jgi:hypothetical protein
MERIEIAQGEKMNVTSAALIKRINRKLKPGLEQLRVTRGARAIFDVGCYHIVDYRMRAVTHVRVDPETLGRELGVLRDHEAVV